MFPIEATHAVIMTAATLDIDAWLGGYGASRRVISGEKKSRRKAVVAFSLLFTIYIGILSLLLIRTNVRSRSLDDGATRDVSETCDRTG